MADIETPPPHLLKKFSTEARDESNKRNGAGYLKTFARLCIEWANSKSTSNPSQIRSSDITPPPELVQRWAREIYDQTSCGYERDEYIARAAAQWGADQELEACCEWLEDVDCEDPQETAKHLRTARRPKPPSLKEQALAALLRLNRLGPDLEDEHTIRRALEVLDD